MLYVTMCIHNYHHHCYFINDEYSGYSTDPGLFQCFLILSLIRSYVFPFLQLFSFVQKPTKGKNIYLDNI